MKKKKTRLSLAHCNQLLTKLPIYNTWNSHCTYN